jgi:predicted metal-dependent HD superfamily phosphohydrolase
MGCVDLAHWWPLPGSTELRDRVVAAYAEPSRRYHDTQHLREVLTRIDELAASGVVFDRGPVLLAAWFHDSVYDGERDAEERSAAWAEAELPDAGVDAATVAEVTRLVRLTETHLPEYEDANGCVLSDADLAILAAPLERYDEYAAAVRREYAHIPDDLFREGRSAVLHELGDKPRLFHTAYAREHWEDAARANLARELSGLEAPVG